MTSQDSYGYDIQAFQCVFQMEHCASVACCQSDFHCALAIQCSASQELAYGITEHARETSLDCLAVTAPRVGKSGSQDQLGENFVPFGLISNQIISTNRKGRQSRNAYIRKTVHEFPMLIQEAKGATRFNGFGDPDLQQSSQ